jgi:hypothetical protein
MKAAAERAATVSQRRLAGRAAMHPPFAMIADDKSPYKGFY